MAFRDLVRAYSSKARGAVGAAPDGAEMYLVPPSRVAGRVLTTAHRAALPAAAASLPAAVSADQLLLLLVHRKVRGHATPEPYASKLLPGTCNF